jgi:hypothetical protein
MDRTFLIALAVALALPGSLAGQAGPDPAAERRVSAVAAAQLKGGSIARVVRLHAGWWAGLVFGDRLAIGGAGYALLRDVELVGSEAGIGFDLRMGYGGLYFAYWRPVSRRVTGQVGLLTGAGHAEVRDRLVGREVGSDNFLVLEPDLAVLFEVHSRVRLGVSLGYRSAHGIENLPTVSAEDLRSATATLSLRIGGS